MSRILTWSPLIVYVWPYLTVFDRIWAIIAVFDRIWAIIAVFGLLLPYLTVFDRIWPYWLVYPYPAPPCTHTRHHHPITPAPTTPLPGTHHTAGTAGMLWGCTTAVHQASFGLICTGQVQYLNTRNWQTRNWQNPVLTKPLFETLVFATGCHRF